MAVNTGEPLNFSGMDQLKSLLETSKYKRYCVRYAVDAAGVWFIIETKSGWRVIEKESGRADVYYDKVFYDFNSAAQSLLKLLDDSGV